MHPVEGDVELGRLLEANRAAKGGVEAQRCNSLINIFLSVTSGFVVVNQISASVGFFYCKFRF